MSGRFFSVACSVRTPIGYFPYEASSGADGVTVSTRLVCATAEPAHAMTNERTSVRRSIRTSRDGVEADMLASALWRRRDLAGQEGRRQPRQDGAERQNGRRQPRQDGA